MARVRHASAVLLTRPRADAIDVYLVERSVELSFFGGYWALPGGTFSADEWELDEPDAARLCAVRELFEETGVAVGGFTEGLDERARNRLREGLLVDELEEWRGHVAQYPGLGRSLHRFCRVTTPPFAPRRYRTWFFQAELPSGQRPEIVAGELSAGQWITPVDALGRWRAGEMLIVPPVLTLLEMLTESASLEEFFTRTGRLADELEQGRLHPVRFTPGVLAAPLLTDTLPPATTTNSYIVGHERLHVVDPATPDAGEQQRLFTLVDELVAGGCELAGILVTHAHPDHVAAVEPMRQRYGLPVRAHPKTLARMRIEPPVGQAIDDGQRIELGTAPDGSGDWALEVLHTPGHEPGHLAFRDTRYGALIAGDLCSTISTIVIDPPDGHLRTYLDSLARVRKLGITTLYPAHGPAARDGNAVLERYIAHRREREEKLVAALASGVDRIEELVPIVYDDTDPALYRYAERSLLAGLEKLVEDGRAWTDGESWSLVDST